MDKIVMPRGASKEFRMLKSLILLLVTSIASQAESSLPTFFCVSEEPRGAIYLQLDEEKQNSVGRMSNPFTSDLEILKQLNPPQEEYTKLNVSHVKLYRTDSGRPFCPECYEFNASPYLPSEDPIVIEASKSWISRVVMKDGSKVLMLKHYVGSDQPLQMICEKL